MNRAYLRRSTPLLALVLGLGLLQACGDDTSGHDAHPTPADSGTAVGCSGDSRVTPFALGMQAKSASGKFVVELLNATPSPPQRGAGDAGVNTWTVKITLDGQPPPVSDVTVTSFMPDHGHGSPRSPLLTANGDGTFAVNDLFLFMAGVWEIRFAHPVEGLATFSLCIP